MKAKLGPQSRFTCLHCC